MEGEEGVNSRENTVPSAFTVIISTTLSKPPSRNSTLCFPGATGMLSGDCPTTFPSITTLAPVGVEEKCTVGCLAVPMEPLPTRTPITVIRARPRIDREITRAFLWDLAGFCALELFVEIFSG